MVVSAFKVEECNAREERCAIEGARDILVALHRKGISIDEEYLELYSAYYVTSFIGGYLNSFQHTAIG
jgi:hypothetical protein